MDATVKAAWVAALRSGKYKQGEAAMYNRTTDAYCCLGVLCAVQDPFSVSFMGLPGSNIAPTPELRAGLDDADINILMAANDTHRWTFEEIATYIEDML